MEWVNRIIIDKELHVFYHVHYIEYTINGYNGKCNVTLQNAGCNRHTKLIANKLNFI